MAENGVAFPLRLVTIMHGCDDGDDHSIWLGEKVELSLEGMRPKQPKL